MSGVKFARRPEEPVRVTIDPVSCGRVVREALCRSAGEGLPSLRPRSKFAGFTPPARGPSARCFERSQFLLTLSGKLFGFDRSEARGGRGGSSTGFCPSRGTWKGPPW